MAEKESRQRDYKLRCSLSGHSMDVRALITTTNGDIITASRDQIAILWKEDPENGQLYEQKVIYKGHTGYVMSVCAIPENEESPEGFTATGSKDSMILIYPRYSPHPVHTLTGHTDAVSCLIWKNDFLVSGSWDHSIRVWKDWDCVNHLEGHCGPVWSVAVIQISSSAEYLIISASADKTLKCWKGGKDIVTYRGHTDCVRGVAALDSTFLSCSNDASIRLWTISGECLATYYGHTSFIYSICFIDILSGFITGGEDRSVRVWDARGNNTHTILLPAQSVWAVASLPNSDIVVGSSDGICRVFTQSVDRQADTKQQAQFEENLANFKVAVQDVGGIKKSDLPDKTFLFTPGKRDGQTVMIRDGEKILCYNWSAAKGEWEAVGEVVGGAGGSASSSGKVLYQGREYDYVFDVDLDEGRILKLPYNRGEDPWVVAQAFIHRHELPQDHLDQVANFITKNADVSSLSLSQGSNYHDPFTGGSRYIPFQGAVSNSRAGDPFTGGGRYVPSFAQEATHPPQTLGSQYFPQKIPLKFESVNKAGILSKLEESNALVAEPLSKEEVEGVVEAVVCPHVDVAKLVPLEKALQWPPERVWPVLDVLRLALRSETAQERWLGPDKGEALAALLVSFLGPPTPIPTQLLALRCLANMASHKPGKCVLAAARNSILPSVVSMTPYPNKNVEIAAATLLINYSTIFTSEKDLESQCQLLSATGTVAISAIDPEAQFRTLVAIGTMLSCSKDIKSLAHSLDMEPIVEKLALSNEPQKVGECARQVMNLLKP